MSFTISRLLLLLTLACGIVVTGCNSNPNVPLEYQRVRIGEMISIEGKTVRVMHAKYCGGDTHGPCEIFPRQRYSISLRLSSDGHTSAIWDGREILPAVRGNVHCAEAHKYCTWESDPKGEYQILRNSASVDALIYNPIRESNSPLFN